MMPTPQPTQTFGAFTEVFGGRPGMSKADIRDRAAAIEALLAGQPYASSRHGMRVVCAMGYRTRSDRANEFCFLLDRSGRPVALSRLGNYSDSGVFRVTEHAASIPDDALPLNYIPARELIQNGTLRGALAAVHIVARTRALSAVEITTRQRSLLVLMHENVVVEPGNLAKLAELAGKDFTEQTVSELRDLGFVHDLPRIPVALGLTTSGTEFCDRYLLNPVQPPLTW